jgi:hypothetical protein
VAKTGRGNLPGGATTPSNIFYRVYATLSARLSRDISGQLPWYGAGLGQEFVNTA